MDGDTRGAIQQHSVRARALNIGTCVYAAQQGCLSPVLDSPFLDHQLKGQVTAIRCDPQAAHAGRVPPTPDSANAGSARPATPTHRHLQQVQTGPVQLRNGDGHHAALPPAELCPRRPHGTGAAGSSPEPSEATRGHKPAPWYRFPLARRTVMPMRVRSIHERHSLG